MMGKSEISSSNIRSLITSGHINEANNLLGAHFGIEGVVVHGTGRGRLLNFQTANIIPKEKNQILPKLSILFCINNPVFIQNI